MDKKLLPWLITLCALGLGGTAGYYSIIGLSKLFAGEATAVIIMASFLEASKLVLATLLHSYWTNLNKLLKTYYIIALVILSLITSVGIYGMLSNGYQKTSTELSVINNKKEYLNQKINFYQTDLNRYDAELERISNNISTLSNAKSTTTQVRDNTVVGGVRSVVSTAELRLAQQRIATEEENRKDIQVKRQISADSLQQLQLQVLELDNNTDTANELGPLKYISNLTGIPMDEVVNWLSLIIIFVFDPLAISLVIAANFAFSQITSKKNPPVVQTPNQPTRGELLAEMIKNDQEMGLYEQLDKIKPIPLDPELNKALEDHTLSKIGNSPSKPRIETNFITPEKVDSNNDGKLNSKEISQAELKIQALKSQLENSNLSSWRRTKIQNQIQDIESQLNKEDDNTIIY